MSSPSSIVIKVKFKKTLRRFIVSIEDEDEKLALDVVMLREKIRGFFNFDFGDEFSMTYVDEDGDNVTLVDDDDLVDIVKQSLDPLRISVELNKSDNGVASQTSGSMTYQVPFQFETLNVNSKVPVNYHEVENLNSKKKETQVQKVTKGVKFKDVSQPSKDVDLNVPDLQNRSWVTPVITTTGVVEGSTGKNKEATDGVEKKKDSGSEKNNESPPQMNVMGTKVPFTFLKRSYDFAPSSGVFKAPNQSPNYKDYVRFYSSSTSDRCNVCGVHPRTGFLYVSRVKKNYNLCINCLEETGKQSPLTRPHDPFIRVPPPTLPRVLQNSMTDVFGSKLNSGFLLDVNVPDGTIMSPSTKFTKVWRMWNNGPIVWPQGTHLQWVSGDRLGSSDSVHVQIPLFGVPVNKEIDIIVNFIAPELPGSYESYWRMASHSGQKFGQQVWIMIKVEDVSVEELGETSINLNLTPVTKNSEVVDNKDPGNSSSKVTDYDVTSVDPKPNDQETHLPINDFIIDYVNEDENDISSITSTQINALNSSVMPSTIVNSAPSSSSIVDSAPSSSSMVPAVQPSGSSRQDIISDQEQTLLEDLEHMGFDHVDLNKEILRRNNYDMEKSIDELCGVSEWDPLLNELEEMGFVDEEANRELLKKNHGSISHVVLDLINGKRE